MKNTLALRQTECLKLCLQRLEKDEIIWSRTELHKILHTKFLADVASIDITQKGDIAKRASPF